MIYRKLKLKFSKMENIFVNTNRGNGVNQGQRRYQSINIVKTQNLMLQSV